MAQSKTSLAVVEPGGNGSLQHQVFESLVLKGDISNLTAEQKVIYLERLCGSLGLNPLTQPFLPLKLSGKETFYATRGATDQLASIHKITREITKTEQISDVYVVTCRASMPDGRFDKATGAVPIGSLKGNDLANALMKAETKAKRRATLSICGLGFLDELEIETIPKEQVDRLNPVSRTSKSELIEQSRQSAPARVQQNDGFSPEQKEMRDEIARFAEYQNMSSDETLRYLDAHPDHTEVAYRKVARKLIEHIFANSDSWNLTDEGTLAWLEGFGITDLATASRRQLQICVADLQGRKILPEKSE